MKEKYGMLDFLFGYKKLKNVGYKLFSKIIEQSRVSEFYSRLGVEDSLDGRFDLMAVHMVILLDKLDQEKDNKKSARLKRILQEIMFDNLDLTLREIGVGDLGVGKKIKVMAEAFYGRMTVYQAAFKEGDTDLISEALLRNLYRGKVIDKNILSDMSAYVRKQHKNIASQPISEIMHGEIEFSLPDGGAND